MYDAPPRSISRSETATCVGAGRREAAELEPDVRAGVRVGLLVRRLGDRHEHDAIEPELVERLLGHHEVADVRRVERPAQDPDLSHGGGAGDAR